MGLHTYLPKAVFDRYEVKDYRHAATILKSDFPTELEELVEALTSFRFSVSEAKEAGRSKSAIFKKMGELLPWPEHEVTVRTSVDPSESFSERLKIQFSRGRVAMFLRWNQKHEAFDQDLATLRRLHEVDHISVGIIVTRADDINELFKDEGEIKFRGTSTHLSKLLPRLDAKRHGGYPLLVFGITKKVVT